MTMAMPDHDKILNAHCAGRDLAAAVMADLRAAGKDVGLIADSGFAEVTWLDVSKASLA
jgi:hypothetical protein